MRINVLQKSVERLQAAVADCTSLLAAHEEQEQYRREELQYVHW